MPRPRADGSTARSRSFATVADFLTRNTELAFLLPWQLLLISAVAVTLICAFSALISMAKVMRLEPAIVFKG